MKPHRASCLPAILTIGCLLSTPLHAATFTWDGGGDATDLGQASNWNPDGIAAASDVLQWNGTVSGSLALQYNTAQAGFNTNPGISISLTSDQTGSLVINGQSSALRLNGSGINIASGAGAFSLGNGSGTSNITAFNGTMAMTNNSSNAATIASGVAFATTFSGITTFNFTGSGNWNVNTNLSSSNNSNGNIVNATGTGTLFMNTANTYSGGTNLNVNGGTSRIRATATGALGSGAVFIAGNGGSNRLEVAGGITLNNALNVNGKTSAVGASAAILNVSGNNNLGGTITLNTGGTDNTIQSDAGLLTLSAATAVTHGASGARGVLFTGEGDTTVSGNITQGGATLALYKQGEGTLTLSGTNNSYTGATLVSAGTLLVNGSLGNTAVSVAADATIGGTGSLVGGLAFDAAGLLEVVDLNDPLAVTGTITFGSGFGIANLTGINWGILDLNTAYTVISTSQTFSASDIGNFGIDNAALVGGGRSAYFDNGSLAVVVIPEPSAALLGGIGILFLLRRRR
jgi:fibronectin-binding autotransporter adhesin